MGPVMPPPGASRGISFSNKHRVKRKSITTVDRPTVDSIHDKKEILRLSWKKAATKVSMSLQALKMFDSVDSGEIVVEPSASLKPAVETGDSKLEDAVNTKLHEEFSAVKDSIMRSQCLDILQRKLPQERSVEDILVVESMVRHDSFFKSLDDNIRGSLCQVLVYRLYEDGDVVFEQGDSGEHFYIIWRGIVNVDVTHNRVTFTAATLVEGQSFGEPALANDEPRKATVRAVGRCEFLTLSKDNYRSILHNIHCKDMNDKAECLSRLSQFGQWNTSRLSNMVDACRSVKLPANVLLCRQHDLITHVYIIKRGSCRVLKEVPTPKIPKMSGGFKNRRISPTARGIRESTTCFVEADRLNPDSFWGETAFLAPGRIKGSHNNSNEEPTRTVDNGIGCRKGTTDEENTRRENIKSGKDFCYRHIASLVTDQSCEVYVLRLSDIMRYSNTDQLRDIVTSATSRASAFNAHEVAAKLVKQIEWEIEKSEILQAL